MGVKQGTSAEFARGLFGSADGAFPNVFMADGEQFIEFGISKRDWFAGQWVAAGHHANLTEKEAAEQAYAFADAMMDARK